MIGYQPVYHRAHLGQQAPVMPPAPNGAPAAAAAPAAAPASALVGGGFLDTLKWAAIGFAAGGVTGFVLGKTGAIPGVGKDGIGSSILGGLGGLVSSVLPKLIGG